MRAKVAGIAGLALAVATAVAAHPHLNKSVTAKLSDTQEAKVSYVTVPSNEELAQAVEVGAFATPGRARLELSADVTAGEKTIAAGEYTVGALRKGDSDWVLALYPGSVGRGETPDTSKLIHLESTFTADAGTVAHLVVDVEPGSGTLEGRIALVMHYGSMQLSGALS
jgi:ribosomal protein L7Ae-like RNA K-turn-binding protein